VAIEEHAARVRSLSVKPGDGAAGQRSATAAAATASASEGGVVAVHEPPRSQRALFKELDRRSRTVKSGGQQADGQFNTETLKVHLAKPDVQPEGGEISAARPARSSSAAGDQRAVVGRW